MTLVWRLNLKWAVSLLAWLFLSAALMASGLFHLTHRDTAVPLLTLVLASTFSPGGLDEEGDIQSARQFVGAGRTLEPFPGLPITLTQEDIEGRSAREIRLRIFSQLAEPLYDRGPAGIAAQSNAPEAARAEFLKNAQLVGLLSQESHVFLRRIALPLWAAAALFLALAVWFSSRWGRLVTPAVIGITASAVPAVFFFVVKSIATNDPALPGTDGPSIGYTLSLVTPLVADAFLNTYRLVLILSGLCLLIALLGRLLISRLPSRKT